MHTYIWACRDSDSLQAGRSGDRIPVGEIFRTYQDRLRGSPNIQYNRYRVFPGGKGGRGVMLTTQPLLVPRLRKSWTIPPLTIWVLMELLLGPLYLLPVHIYDLKIPASRSSSQCSVTWQSGQQILCKEYATHNIWQVITFTATKKWQLYSAHKQKDAEENI